MTSKVLRASKIVDNNGEIFLQVQSDFFLCVSCSVMVFIGYVPFCCYFDEKLVLIRFWVNSFSVYSSTLMFRGQYFDFLQETNCIMCLFLNY